MKRFYWPIMALTTVLLLAACGNTAGTSDETRKDKETEGHALLREMASPEGILPTPKPTNTQLDRLREQGVRLAGDLFDHCDVADENMVFAPLSAYMTLETLAAIGGEEEKNLFRQQMGEEMRFTDYDADVRALRGILKDVSTLRYHANLIASDEFSLNQTAMTELMAPGGPTCYQADFSDIKVAENNINALVKEQTNGLVEEVFQDTLKPETYLVLLDNLFFASDWSKPFRAAGDQSFHGTKGTVQIPFMARTALSEYAADEKGVYLGLGYEDDAMQMVIYMPADGDLTRALKEEIFRHPKTTYMEVHLDMPIFRVENKLDFKQYMAKSAFAPYLETFHCTLVDPPRTDFVGNIFQVAVMDVNEKGTRAASSTVATVEKTAAPMDPVQVTLDKPFAYALFYGRLPLYVGVFRHPTP
ncbi:MAG: serpin family protein [Eubacteriales bacterium]|nr:serpin family protein [Eubacteriales bacterium]